MRFYHGTLSKFSRFNLQFARPGYDFGLGIYLTDSYDYALQVIKQKSQYLPNKPQHGYIRSYDIDIDSLGDNLLVFEWNSPDNYDDCPDDFKAPFPVLHCPCDTWIDFVVHNYKYDTRKVSLPFILGPATDNLSRSIIMRFLEQECSNLDHFLWRLSGIRFLLECCDYTAQLCLTDNYATSLVDKCLVSVTEVEL